MDFPSGLKNDLMINFKNHCSENKKRLLVLWPGPVGKYSSTKQ